MRAIMRNYAIQKLRLAALKLEGEGPLGERYRLAESDLSAVQENHLPERLRPEFRTLKAAIKDHARDHGAIAFRLHEMASSLSESPQD